jgi:hypothetical protein
MEQMIRPDLMRRIALLFLIPACAGFVAISWVHVNALIGKTGPFNRSMEFLVPGLWIWLPTIIFAGWLSRTSRQNDLWNAVLRGCPIVMQRIIWVVFSYCWAGFFIFPMLNKGIRWEEINNDRVASGILLAFYLIAAAILYSAAQSECTDKLKERQCSAEPGSSTESR